MMKNWKIFGGASVDTDTKEPSVSFTPHFMLRYTSQYNWNKNTYSLCDKKNTPSQLI